jgi:transposase
MRCRCKIILALVRGSAPSMIAAGGLGAKSQVYRVAERFLAGGLAGLADRREDNGQPKITPAYQAELLSLVAGTPRQFGYRRPTWTQELLARVLAERLDLAISAATMSRLLGRLGVGLRRPKPVVKCPWKAARRRRRLRQIERLVMHLPADEVVLYVDEVDIHLNPEVGPDWMRRGRQKRVVTPGCNQKRYLAGAWDPRARRLVYVEGGRKNSLLFLQLLHKLATKSDPNARRIHVILDNYKIHSSRAVEKYLAKPGCRVRLHFLPPYCPDDNKIEHVWLDLHANVTRNHRCRTMEELMVQVVAFLRAYNQRKKLNPSLKLAAGVSGSRSVV